MKIKTISHGTFKVDGGAMFGPVPKSMWNKKYPADDNNLCTLTMRSLIVETDDRLVLIDTGIGNKHSEKYLSFIYPELNDIKENIANAGYSPEDFTDIIVTHLHYDHAGGCTYKENDGSIKPTFPNAKYWLTKSQWELMQNPNPREKSALFIDDILPVMEAGQLNLIEKGTQLTNEITLLISNGHTKGMIVPVIQYSDKLIVFAADMIPTLYNIHLPWVSAYDNYPLTLMEEKKFFLQSGAKHGYVFVFEHDAYNECATVKYDETKDKFLPDKVMAFTEIL
jgi:glyoxylase-like metal-dependent hydrolase (beta-lactamase superfamily II)